MDDETIPPDATLPPSWVAPTWIDHARIGMAFLLVSAFIGAILALSYFNIPVENKETIYMMIGVLGGWGGSTIQFLFGSQIGKDGRDQQRETRLIGMVQKREGS